MARRRRLRLHDLLVAGAVGAKSPRRNLVEKRDSWSMRLFRRDLGAAGGDAVRTPALQRGLGGRGGGRLGDRVAGGTAGTVGGMPGGTSSGGLAQPLGSARLNAHQPSEKTARRRADWWPITAVTAVSAVCRPTRSHAERGQSAGGGDASRELGRWSGDTTHGLSGLGGSRGATDDPGPRRRRYTSPPEPATSMTAPSASMAYLTPSSICSLLNSKLLSRSSSSSFSCAP